MKIQNNFYPIIKVNTNQTFGQAVSELKDSERQSEIQTSAYPLPNVNVRVPIGYSHTEDIKFTDDITAHCYKLSNGQRIVIVPKDGPTLIKSYVNTGSFNEPDNLRGISHFIEHNLFNGSEDLGEAVFFDEVNKMGAATNASTSFDKTDYFIISNLLEDTDLEKQVQLHAGMLQSPKFLVDKLEKEKKIVDEEINMCVSESENLGFSQTVKNLFNIKSSSLDLVAGSTNNIDNLTRDDVINYFNNNYYPANTVTVITGEVNPQETMDLVSKYFKSDKVQSAPRYFEKMTPTDKAVRQDIISNKTDSNKTSIFLGFTGPENNNAKDKIMIQALGYLLGGLNNSRFSNIEKKYATGINISPEKLSSRPEDKSMLLIETGVGEEKSEKLIKEIYSIIHNLTTTLPTEEELTAVKNTMIKINEQRLETSAGVNNAIGSALLNNNIAQMKDFNKIVNKMTAQDILNTAKKYFDLNKVALTVVHPSFAEANSISNNHKIAQNISFQGRNKKTPIDTTQVRKYKLDNNFEIICRDSKSENVEYSFKLKEKIWTPKKAAVANILSDILKNAGSLNKTTEEQNKFSDYYGIDSSISAGNYGINLEANFPAKNTKSALEFFNDRIKNPKINDETLKISIARLKEAYSRHEVSPYDKFAKIVYKGTPMEFSKKDLLESLDTVTVEDVKNFYNEIFTKGIGTIAVSAPFSKYPELKQEIFNSAGSFNKVEPNDISLEKRYSPIEKTVVCTDVHKKNSAKIIQGYTFKRSKNIKDLMTVDLLNEILGGSPASRLFMDLRENRHLAYSVGSGYNYQDDMGVMTLYITTTTENQETGVNSFDNIRKSIKGFNDNIKRITTEKVSAEELEAAKKNLKSMILNTTETNAGKNYALLQSNNTYYGLDFYNQRLTAIDAITADDIYNAACHIFNSKPIYSLTATKNTLKANEEYLKSLED